MGALIPRTRRAARRRRGFTIAELLIAAALTATLTGSAALFVHAAFHSQEQNETELDLTRSARFVMNRVLSDVRNAESVERYSGSGLLQLTLPDTGMGPAAVSVEHTGGQLLYTRTCGEESSSTPIVGGDVTVEYAYFSKLLGTDAEGAEQVDCVTLYLGLRRGKRVLRLVGSACPRRNHVH